MYNFVSLQFFANVQFPTNTRAKIRKSSVGQAEIKFLRAMPLLSLATGLVELSQKPFDGNWDNSLRLTAARSRQEKCARYSRAVKSMRVQPVRIAMDRRRIIVVVAGVYRSRGLDADVSFAMEKPPAECVFARANGVAGSDVEIFIGRLRVTNTV